MPRPDEGQRRRSRVVFFGSGDFAVPILAGLVARPDLEVVGVVTPPDSRVGRAGRVEGVPVAVAARTSGIEPIQIARVRDASAIVTIRGLEPDIGVLADFGQIIPSVILELPKLGILNVHPSLLPRHRGATPIPATILAGDAMAGVSVMAMDAGLDTGPVVATRAWMLAGTEDGPTLERRAAAEGAELLGEVLDAVLAGRSVPTPQDSAAATMTRPLTRESGRLDPERPAVELERRVRALRSWPGTFIEVGEARIAVHAATVGASGLGDTPGHVVAVEDGLALATVDGRLLLDTVQPAGGRRMTGAAYRRGRPTIIGQAVSSAPPPRALGRRALDGGPEQ